MRLTRTILVPAATLALLLVPPTSLAGTLDAPSPTPVSIAAPDRVEPEACTITGTNDDDKLEGTGVKDVICGLGGDDVIDGLAGDDVILGGPGFDQIDGGNGHDAISGNLADDDLKGGEGNDSFSGGDGSDWCRQNRGTGSTDSCEWPNPLLTCPVARGTVYDDFGDDRGDHRHQGNDITAKKGEPVLATFPGKTENSRAEGAGLYVTLTRADGSFTYGMHLSRFRPEDRYKTGDVIGFVGSSGNAGSINHLHFEWHPDGGAAIDPFPYLSKVCASSARSPIERVDLSSTY